MKIYISSDFEGATAVVGTAGKTLTESPQLDFARRIVTAENNPAVEGALAGGATEVIVNDCHGGGLNLIYDELHPEARIILGSPRPRRFLGLEGSAALFLIAYHSMAGTQNGILSHSYSSVGIQNMWLNDHPIGEIGLDGALAGQLGIPVALVTSDKAGVEEALAIAGPKTRTVIVKEGISRNAAISLHPAKAQALIRAAAEDAVRNIGEMSPIRFEPPFRLRREYKFESYADQAMRAAIPGQTRIDSRTVERVSDNLFDLI
jgi:D-amino peptidase